MFQSLSNKVKVNIAGTQQSQLPTDFISYLQEYFSGKDRCVKSFRTHSQPKFIFIKKW